MDPESKKLLEDTLHLEQDNNKMLHSIRRTMRFSSVMTFIYWIIIIGSAIGTYYYFQPYFNKILGVYNSIVGTQYKLPSKSVPKQ
jgi:hypothetical protein